MILFNILIDRGQELVQNVENIQPRLFQPSLQQASFQGGNLIFDLCPFIGMLLKVGEPQKFHLKDEKFYNVKEREDYGSV